MLILGMAISYLFIRIPAVAVDYNNTNLMRPWSDPLMSIFFLYPFVQGLIFSWAWNKTKGLFTGNRGVKFGGALWLVATVPGMLVSYSSFPLSFLTIISWLASGLVSALAAGIIFAKMNK
jgi:nitrogen fixation/metabolism regulation signal transduction histidine kinase